MRRARVAAELPGTALAAELRWRDPATWAGFVDGFDRVVSLDEAWPEPGAQVTWESHPGGRGRVTERVLEHDPGRLLVTATSDPELEGTQRAAFEDLRLGVVRVALELEYRLVNGGPLMLVVDPLFVRRAIRDSQRRTLDRLAAELAP